MMTRLEANSRAASTQASKDDTNDKQSFSK
jgi:hypothetical protein